MTSLSRAAAAVQVRDQAQATFGSGLVDLLVQQFGEEIGHIVLQWLLSRQQSTPMPAHALADGATLRRFLASELAAHRDEVLALIAQGYDAGVAALKP